MLVVLLPVGGAGCSNTMGEHKASAHGRGQTGDLRKNRGSSASKRLATHGGKVQSSYIDTRLDVMQKSDHQIQTTQSQGLAAQIHIINLIQDSGHNYSITKY